MFHFIGVYIWKLSLLTIKRLLRPLSYKLNFLIAKFALLVSLALTIQSFIKRGLIMFLIMGSCHLLAAFVLALTYPGSNDLIVHAIGGLIELSIGAYVFVSNNYKFF